MSAIEEDIHVLAKKLDKLENRVEHVVDKVVELGDRYIAECLLFVCVLDFLICIFLFNNSPCSGPPPLS